MSQDSTFSSVVRTLVMLAALVVIPIVAVCAPSLPRTMMQEVERHWPTLAEVVKPAASPPETAAPEFKPLTAENPPPASFVPRTVPATDESRLASSDVGRERFAVAPVAYEAPLSESVATTPGVVSATPRAGGDASSSPSHGSMASSTDPISALSGGNSAVDRPNAVREPTDLRTLGGRDRQNTSLTSDRTNSQLHATAVRNDQFSTFQSQLRELGATYFMLESWGTKQQLYRFYCKMAVGGNPNCTRHFEATDADPLHAMSLVLEQVRNSQPSQGAVSLGG